MFKLFGQGPIGKDGVPNLISRVLFGLAIFRPPWKMCEENLTIIILIAQTPKIDPFTPEAVSVFLEVSNNKRGDNSVPCNYLIRASPKSLYQLRYVCGGDRAVFAIPRRTVETSIIKVLNLLSRSIDVRMGLPSSRVGGESSRTWKRVWVGLCMEALGGWIWCTYFTSVSATWRALVREDKRKKDERLIIWDCTWCYIQFCSPDPIL